MANAQVDRLLEKAREVAKLEADLNRARDEFSKLAGVLGPRVTPHRGPGSDSVSQRVLKLLESGPRARKDIVAAIGEPSAVSSAIKKHAQLGRIEHTADGLWALAKSAPASHKTPVEVRKTKGRAP